MSRPPAIFAAPFSFWAEEAPGFAVRVVEAGAAVVAAASTNPGWRSFRYWLALRSEPIPKVVELAFLFLFVGHGVPGFVRVEEFHLLELVEGLRSKVSVIDNPVVADDEGSHSSYAVFCRSGD